MGVAQGQNIALGWGAESTYGTVVEPTAWSEVLSEGLDFDPTDLVSEGLAYGTQFVRQASRRIRSMRHATGNITIELPRTGIDLLLTAMLGTLTAGPPKVWTVGSLAGDSLTLQKQIYDDSLTEIETFTYHGAKVASWTVNVQVDQFPQLTVDFDIEDVDSSTSLTSPSYSDPSLWSFLDATVDKDTTAVTGITSFQLQGNNNLQGRRYLGNSGLQGEPIPQGFREYTGNLAYDFASAATFWDEFDDNTSFDLELEFLDTGTNEALTFELTECFVTSEMPKVGGAGPVQQTVNFMVLYDGSTSPVTVTYTAAT